MFLSTAIGKPSPLGSIIGPGLLGKVTRGWCPKIAEPNEIDAIVSLWVPVLMMPFGEARFG